MGLPVSTYLGYKILQQENDISSGKDTSVLFFLLSSFTYYFFISAQVSYLLLGRGYFSTSLFAENKYTEIEGRGSHLKK